MALFDPLDVDLSGRECRGCGEFKPWSEFYGDRARCRPCVIRQTSKDRRHIPGWGAIRQAACRAKKKGLPFDLYEHRDKIVAQFEAGCELSGLPFDFTEKGKGKMTWNSPSIDRLDADKGYVFSNVRVVLWCLNAGFGNWGEDQFAVAAKAWLERRK